ncbi:unnamed protein product, partial [Closterium sp. Naga37s-1]
SSVLFSNRSAAHAAMKNFQQALHDGRKALQLQPRWAKAYSRIAVAHYGMKHTVCKQGLQQARERWQQEDEKEAKTGKHTFRKRKAAEGGTKGEGKEGDAPSGRNQKKASGGQGTTQKGAGSLLSFDDEAEFE